MRSLFSLLILLILVSSCVVDKEGHYSRSYTAETSRNVMRVYFPNQSNNSISVSGDSPLLRHYCPVVVSGSKYIYIDFVFADTAFKEENLALYNVFIEKKEAEDGKELWKAVTDNYYYAGNYIYTIRLKNIYPVGEYRMWYGFYLKSDSLNPYPRLYKRVCQFEIQ